MRKGDWFFVIVFSLFALTSLFSDRVHALNGINAETAAGRANLWFCDFAGDDYLKADHSYARVNSGISAFIYGPFYLVLVYAFLKGKNWIRIPAFIWAGMMVHGFTEFFWWEFTEGTPPRHLLPFLAFYLPYVVMPFVLGYRMREAEPFKT